MKYEYGPNVDFKVKTTGEMYEINGSYESMNDSGKELLQTVCHALYQMRSDILSAKDQIVNMKNVWIHHIGNSYSIYTKTMQTMLKIYETGPQSFEVEFFSPKEFLAFGDEFLDYAWNHVCLHGHAE